MDDFPDLFAKDFGIKPQGKSAPMAPPWNSSSGPNYGYRSDYTRSSSTNTKSSSNPIFDDQDRDGLSFNDVYGGPPKYSSESRASTVQNSSFDYDSLFKETKAPVYDKPVYDDDLFDGLPGIKSSSTTSAAKFDDVFSVPVSPPPPKHKSASSSPLDDLLGNLGRKETETKVNSERVKAEKEAPLFDDLLPGFGRSSSPAPVRSNSEAGQSQNPVSNSSKTGSNLMEDPFVVLGSTSDPAHSSSGLFTDPSEISKLNGSGKSRVESSSGSGGVFDDLDPLDGIGKSVPFVSSEVNKRGKDMSPLRTSSGPQTSASKEPNDEVFEHYTKKRMPSMGDFPASHQPVFDMPSMSTNFNSSGGRATSPPAYSNVGSNDTSSQVNTTPRSENFDTFDDVWLTVSEIPLFTQPTSAPPPSRPPPPRPPRASKPMPGSSSSTNAKKKVNDFSSFPNSSQYSHSSQSAYTAASSNVTSQIDELEDFAMGKAQNNFEQAEVFPGDDFETSSVAAASAAAMKEAMDRAEAKFRHAKEMRERGNARNKEAGQMDKDERATQDALDREVIEKQERLERERQQREIEEEEREQRRRELEREKEEEERTQRRLEKERERVRQMEREKERGRQAVERATREARERAAAEARTRAERAAVEKASTEARQRAERAAVQRAQTEARERAAAEARERAERAARERAERAAAETREREARSRDAAAKAEAEARSKAERAAAEARERAAATARANQQKNDDDLESFFMGSRPSSAPRPGANSSDPLFDGQSKGGPEVASSMRKASSTANVVDDLSSIFGAAASSSGEFQEVNGETEERRRARLERHQRTQERTVKALAEKNQRDLQVQREQAERLRIAETLDVEIKRWSAGKEGNLRALLSTLQYVLWPECGWQPVSLTDLITAAAVKKAYRKATLCIHPDKVQQKGANLQQKYVAEKVFDLLKEAWNKFNSEELF